MRRVGIAPAFVSLNFLRPGFNGFWDEGTARFALIVAGRAAVPTMLPKHQGRVVRSAGVRYHRQSRPRSLPVIPAKAVIQCQRFHWREDAGSLLGGGEIEAVHFERSPVPSSREDP